MKNDGDPSAEERGRASGLKAKDDLEIEVREGNAVLKPRVRRVYRLEDLVKRITLKNVHGENDSGIP